MKKYLYQKFLLGCNYENLRLEECPRFDGDIEQVIDYRFGECILDESNNIRRRIDITDVDQTIDTEQDWKNLIKKLDNVDTVILYNTEVNSKNEIIRNYREATLKAIIYRLRFFDKEVLICKSA